MRTLGLVAVALLGAACSSPGAAQEGREPQLTDATLGGTLWVPKGFQVTEYAKVARGRFMAAGPTGAIYISQPRDGQIVSLIDSDGDGAAESQQVVVTGLNRPHGLVVREGWLYVANTDALVRVKLDAAGGASGSPETLATYSGGDGHWTRTVIFGADGAIYVSIGSSCNVCVEQRADRATVMRYDPSGRNGRVFSSGLRNAVGMAVHPTTGAIWVTQNERDDLTPDHQNLPHEEINILADGADFGWPYCHDDREPNPEYNDAGRCQRTLAPALALAAIRLALAPYSAACAI